MLLGMPWTAPDVERADPPAVADERATLDGFLDYHRQTLLGKCAGLAADRLRERACPPSELSLLGLVRHLAEVERSWLRRRVSGEDVPYLYVREDDEDAEFHDVDTADAAADFATYRDEVAACRAAVAGRNLDETFVHPRTGETLSVRWVLNHLLEEYARHNGHADLLRERIDGATGE
jgi:uncharacterized damage-inducible protein DinB